MKPTPPLTCEVSSLATLSQDFLSSRRRYLRCCLLAAVVSCDASPPTTFTSDADAATAPGDAQTNHGDGATWIDGAPTTVLACDKLGAVQAWEKITIPAPSGFVLPSDEQGIVVTGVAVDPRTAGVVYMSLALIPQIRGLGLWRSENCGATWTRVATGKNADAINSGTQYTILFDPRDPNVIISQSFYGNGSLYRSANRGIDWEDISPKADGAPSFVLGASMDPSDPDHLLATFHDNCAGAFAPMCLGESLDGGKTWRLVRGPSNEKGWAEAAGAVILKTNTWLYNTPWDGVYYTSDAGSSWEQILGYPGCFGSVVHAPDGNYYMPCVDTFGVQQSSNGHDWTHVANSLGATGIILAGSTWYESYSHDSSGHPVYSAPASDVTHWTSVATPTIAAGGWFAYDSDHQVLYSASGTEFWRVVTH